MATYLLAYCSILECVSSSNSSGDCNGLNMNWKKKKLYNNPKQKLLRAVVHRCLLCTHLHSMFITFGLDTTGIVMHGGWRQRLTSSVDLSYWLAFISDSKSCSLILCFSHCFKYHLFLCSFSFTWPVGNSTDCKWDIGKLYTLPLYTQAQIQIVNINTLYPKSIILDLSTLKYT